MSEPRAVTVMGHWPPSGGSGPWQLRVAGEGNETTVARISPTPPPGHGRRRHAMAAEVDGVCLSLSERCAAGEPMPSDKEAGYGVYRAIVGAVRDVVRRRQLRGAE